MTRPHPFVGTGITGAVFDRFADADPHRPRLVWYGEQGRTELSTASLTNWAAKTAGYLCDELGATAGDLVVWRVRRSWQGLPLLLGCWWAGLVVHDDESMDGDSVAAFVDEGDESAADEVVVASSHPFGLAVPNLAVGYRQVADAVLPQADRFSPHSRPAEDSPALLTPAGAVTVNELLGRIDRAASALTPHGVLLSTSVPSLPDGVCAGPLAAWAADGTLIQIGPDADADRNPAGIAHIAREERATATLGEDTAGLPRID